MKTIRMKIITRIIMCSLLTAVVIGALAMINASTVAREDAKENKVVISLGEVTPVDYDNILVYSDLRSGKTAAVRILQGLLHVFKEFRNPLLVVQINIGILATENIRTI